MNTNCLHRRLLASAAVVLGSAMLVAGCNMTHPDEKAPVNEALKSSNLSNIDVSQDRTKGVMTLKGNVATEDDKKNAARVAERAAPDYTVANEIGVRPPQEAAAGQVDAKLDSAIEDNFKAAIKAHESLNKQSINASAKNGTLVIKGSVKTPEQKHEASNLAKQVPNVLQVVNELEVKPGKHSTPNS